VNKKRDIGFETQCFLCDYGGFFIIAALLGLIGWGVYSLTRPPSPAVVTPVAAQAAAGETPAAGETAVATTPTPLPPGQANVPDDWLTYTNLVAGYSFSYPPDWTGEENGNYAVLYPPSGLSKFEVIQHAEAALADSTEESGAPVAMQHPAGQATLMEISAAKGGLEGLSVRIQQKDQIIIASYYSEPDNMNLSLEEEQFKILVGSIRFKP